MEGPRLESGTDLWTNSVSVSCQPGALGGGLRAVKVHGPQMLITGTCADS